ncbi:MAG: hypothetical protein ABJL54_10645 [Halioglobus sp.]
MFARKVLSISIASLTLLAPNAFSDEYADSVAVDGIANETCNESEGTAVLDAGEANCTGEASDTLGGQDASWSPPNNAFGFASLGDEGRVVLDFDDNYCLVGEGADVVVGEFGSPDTYSVRVATRHVSPMTAGSVSDDGNGHSQELDLSPLGVSGFNQIEVKDSGDLLTTINHGADLDFVQCSRSADVLTSAKVSGTIRDGEVGKNGKQPIRWSFSGWIGQVEYDSQEMLVGSVQVNYRELKEVCTFYPTEGSTLIYPDTSGIPDIGDYGYKITGVAVSGCGLEDANNNNNVLHFVDRDAPDELSGCAGGWDAPRGAFKVQTNFDQYDVWSDECLNTEFDPVPLTTGNVHVNDFTD